MRIENKQLWPIVEHFWKASPPDSSHIRSYNDFILKIEKLTQKEIIFQDVKIKIDTVQFIAPSDEKGKHMFPSMCIMQKETYQSNVTASFHYYFKDELLKTEENVVIGAIPVMVGCQLCNLVNVKSIPDEIKNMEFKTNLGGWFVRKGISRVIIFQERNKFNKPMAIKCKDKDKFDWKISVRNSVTEQNTTAVLDIYLKTTPGSQTNPFEIWGELTYLQKDKRFPILLIFKALGYSNKEICDFIFPDKTDHVYKDNQSKLILLKMFELGHGIDPITELAKLGREWPEGEKWSVKEQYVQEELIKKRILHHYDTKLEKVRYLGWVIYSLISLVVKKKQKGKYYFSVEDRDHFGNKVLQTECELFSNVYYSGASTMYNCIEKIIKKEFEGKSEKLSKNKVESLKSTMLLPVYGNVDKMPITTAISKALGDNQWLGNKKKKEGVSEIYQPKNYNDANYLLTKSVLYMQNNNSPLAPRMVQPSFWCGIDFFDTPESAKIGFNKVLATTAYITSKIDAGPVYKILAKYLHPLNSTECDVSLSKIFVNNEWYSCASKDTCLKLVNKIKKLKRVGKIDPTIGVFYNGDSNEMFILTQEGRVTRPWLVVKDKDLVLDVNKKYKSWNDVMQTGGIEFLDANELEYCKLQCVSVENLYDGNEYDYCDIHPATLFGVGVGSITSPNQAQGPRSAYGANQCRQAMGFTTRFDSPFKLFYPQAPLIKSVVASKLLHYDKFPSGVNVTIGLCENLGFTQEDGYVVNKAYIDRGGFMSSYKIFKELEIDGEKERLEIPIKEECQGYSPKNLSNIDERGIVKKGSIVEYNDPLCCKVRIVNIESYIKKDATLLHKDKTTCYVQDVFVKQKKHKSGMYIKIVLREVRVAKYGNKFAPRSAQKGTITYVCPQEDMPFSPSKYTSPTLTMMANPLCIPSRMTINYLEEFFLSNMGCLPAKTSYSNIYENGTAFDENTQERYQKVKDWLKENGYRSDGCRQMISGRTGEPLMCDIYVGVVHMQILKHMVDDKISARSEGKMTALMGCPTTNSKEQDGGIKISCLQKDTMIANDCPTILQDRMCLSSDKVDVSICMYCGNSESFNYAIGPHCRICKKDNAMKTGPMSKSTKVVFDELKALCLGPRYIL